MSHAGYNSELDKHCCSNTCDTCKLRYPKYFHPHAWDKLRELDKVDVKNVNGEKFYRYIDVQEQICKKFNVFIPLYRTKRERRWDKIEHIVNLMKLGLIVNLMKLGLSKIKDKLDEQHKKNQQRRNQSKKTKTSKNKMNFGSILGDLSMSDRDYSSLTGKSTGDDLDFITGRGKKTDMSYITGGRKNNNTSYITGGFSSKKDYSSLLGSNKRDYSALLGSGSKSQKKKTTKKRKTKSNTKNIVNDLW